MILIVGLGNPGKKYEFTRHNIGARTVKELEFLELKNVLPVKPTTFMNESGKAVRLLIRKRGIKTADLVVIHDDLDIVLGEIKIVKNRGAAGHKGVESIIKELGTKNFIRFRIGIQPKQYHRLVRGTIEKFVLQKFNKEEEKMAKKVIKKTAEAIEFFLKEGLEKTMTEFNC